MKRMGHSTTVWTLVLILAAVGAVATGMAAWTNGPNTKIPEVDSNFWSTISQNSVGSAGLYCLMIPILQGVKVEVDSRRLFKFWLSVSGIGALLSTCIYIFHVRTSIVLGYLSSIAQLFATLQLIVDAGTQVSGLQDVNERLENTNEELKFTSYSLNQKNIELEQRLASVIAHNDTEE